MNLPVVGFDIGRQSCYISIIRGGGIDTICNEYSDRSTQTCISFTKKLRYVGPAAKNNEIKNISNTVSGFNFFLGKKYNDPTVKLEMPYAAYTVLKMENEGAGIQVDYQSNRIRLYPEQLVAMQLAKLKTVVDKELGTEMSDVVINVPCYYTDVERRAMLSAAQIAGLNCRGLINDITAIGLAYGFYNTDLPPPNSKPRYVAFVDMGHANFQVMIAAFTSVGMRILATGWDADLGGQNFDRCIFYRVSSEMENAQGLYVFDNAKAICRLMQECERVKKTLSANSTSIAMNIDCLMSDQDVTSKINRREFEELIEPFVIRLENVMSDVMQESGVSSFDLHSVEITGGSTRVPMVKAAIDRVFGTGHKTTLNSDEAVARGCAVKCASQSTTCRIKPFEVIDIAPYTIKASYQDVSVNLFAKKLPLPSRRMINIPCKSTDKSFKLNLYYDTSDSLHNIDREIGTYMINPQVCAGPNLSKISLHFCLNTNGICELEEAKPLNSCNEVYSVNPDKTNESLVSKVSEDHTIEKLQMMRQLEVDMQRHIWLEQERAIAKNSLEEFIYTTREMLESHACDQQVTTILKYLNEIESWLEEENDASPKEKYVCILEELVQAIEMEKAASRLPHENVQSQNQVKTNNDVSRESVGPNMEEDNIDCEQFGKFIASELKGLSHKNRKLLKRELQRTLLSFQDNHQSS